MKENKEINALLHLIDDPDEEVYTTVSDRILSIGKGIIPNLEHLWEHTTNLHIQERIERIIHQLHFRDLKDEFADWKKEPGDLLRGTLLVSRYHYPEMQTAQVRQDFEKIRRNIWIELNQYLTPLEQTSVFNSILYNYYKLSGIETAYHHPEDFLVNKGVELKKGNALCTGLIYLILCELLDIPVKAVHIPRQFVLAYMDAPDSTEDDTRSPGERIKFFIDPVNGQIYSHKDIESYFKRLSIEPPENCFRPFDHTALIRLQLDELGKCFDEPANFYKLEELKEISGLLGE